MDSANILNQPLKKSHVQQIQTSLIGTLYLAVILTIAELVLFYKNIISLHRDFKKKIKNIRNTTLEKNPQLSQEMFLKATKLEPTASSSFFNHDKKISQQGYDYLAIVICIIFIMICMILSILWRENISWKHVGAFVGGSASIIIPFQIYFTENVIKKTKTMSDEEIIEYVDSLCDSSKISAIKGNK